MTDTPLPPGDSDAARAERHRRRSTQTRRAVVWGEKIAGGVITVGG